MTLTEQLQPLLEQTKRVHLAVVFALMVSPAMAQEHLEPARSIVESYENSVASTLKDAFKADVHVRAIVEPSFEPEFAVGTRKDGGVWSVYYLVAEEQVWPQLATGKETSKIQAQKCAVVIPAALGAQIDSVWEKMLGETRAPDEQREGLDGEFYYFSKKIGGDLRIGMIWSPAEGTKPGKLVGIAYTMRDLCQQKSDALVAKLSAQVTDLLAQFPN